MKISRHAAKRMQQRAIDTAIVTCLQHYGKRVRVNNGGMLIHFDRKSRKRVADALGHDAYVRLEKKLDTYLVATEGKITTVGHRYKRIRAH